MARADQGMGGGVAGNRAGPNGHNGAGAADAEVTDGDLANDIMGDAGQQGPSDMKGGADDKLSNTRETQAGGNRDADGNILDSFKTMDKDVRAEKDLGAGNMRDHDASENESLVDDMSDPEKADSSLAARNGI